MEKALMAKKVKRALEIINTLEKNKELYSEMDQLIFDLVGEKGLEDFGLAIVDNYKEKNTAYRMAAVRRLEFKVIEAGKTAKKS